MKKTVMKFVLAAFSAGLFGLTAAISIPAQFPMTEGKNSNRTDSDRDLEERIAYMRYLAAIADKRGVKRKVDPQLAIGQLQEDFTRLQVLNKDLVLTSAKTEKLDLKFVSRSATEINKRAERLLSNLALPEPSPDDPAIKPQPVSDIKALKASIVTLGWEIYRFVKSPLFKEPNVLDTPEAGKARRELENIIELSLHLKKNSEQLAKTPLGREKT